MESSAVLFQVLMMYGAKYGVMLGAAVALFFLGRRLLSGGSFLAKAGVALTFLILLVYLLILLYPPLGSILFTPLIRFFGEMIYRAQA